MVPPRSSWGLSVPEPSEMDIWRSALDQVVKDIDRLEREETRLLADRNRLSGLIEAKRSETGVIGDEEAAQLRALRDEAWADSSRDTRCRLCRKL